MGIEPEPKPARTVELSAAVLAVSAGVLFGLVQLRPIHDVDLFWQVRSGEIILDTGRLPVADPFTSTHAGAANPQIYWLSQAFYAGFLRVADWSWLHALDSLAFVGSFWLVASAVRVRSANALPVLAAFVLAVVVSIPHHSLRPQTFGLLGFAVVVRVEGSSLRPAGKAALLAVAIALWQNLHPSASVAVGYLGAKGAAAWWRWLRGRGPRVPVPPALLPLIAVVLLPLTPTGFDVFGVSAANADVSRLIGIEEWLPVWHPAAWGGAKLVWVGLVLTAVLFAGNVRHLRADDVAVLLVFTVAAVAVYRMSLFWCVAMIPVWARWIDGARPRGVFEGLAGDVRAWGASAVGAVAWVGALIGPVLAGAPLFDAAIPLAGVGSVEDLGVRGVVYNYREWGGPLVWANHPRLRVTIDGRLYLYPPEDWDHYLRAARGEVPVEEIEARFRPDAFFLRPSYHAALIDLIRETGRWDEVYRDEVCVLFLPKRGER